MTQTHGTQTSTEHYVLHARKIGTEHGKNAASWVEIDEATAEAIDQAPSGSSWSGARSFQNVYDVLEPTSPLSGEWADGYSVARLYEDVGYSPPDGEDGALVNSVSDAYEDAYWQAFGEEIERKVEALRGPTLSLDPTAAYAVDGFGWGVAWRYVGQTFGGRARMVMVGDDQEHIVDEDDVRTLPEDDYCHECGQVGCTADGRERT